MRKQTVHRFIAAYEKDGDAHLGDLDVSDDQFATLRRLLGYPDSDRMCGCFPLEGEVLDAARRLLPGTILEDDHAFFLEDAAIE